MTFRPRVSVPALALVTLVATALARLAFGDSFIARDIYLYVYPMKAYLRARLALGQIPLWNPLAGFGRPVLGMIQPGVFDPFNALLALPLPTAYDAFTAVHVLLAGFGLRRWLLALGTDDPSSSAAGVAFALSGYMATMATSNGTYLFGAALVPWMLATHARQLADGPSPDRRVRASRIARLALWLVFILVSGDPMAAYFAGIVCGVQALALDSRPRVLAALGDLAAAAVFALFISAVQLLPAREVLAHARPAGLTATTAGEFNFHPVRLLEWLYPAPFGEPYSDAWFVYALGRGVSDNLRADPLVYTVYSGLLVPFGALAALIVKPRRRLDVALALLAGFAMLVAFGPHTPLWPVLFRVVPGLGVFRHPEKFLYLATLSLCALGGRGIAVLVEHPRTAARVGLPFFIALSAFAIVAVFAGPWLARALVGDLGGVAPALAGQILRQQGWRAVAVAGTILAPLVLRALDLVSHRSATYVLSVLLAADVWVASFGVYQWEKSDTFRHVSVITEAVRAESGTGALPFRFFRPTALEVTDERFAARPPASLMRETLKPDSGMEDGIVHLDAYDAVQPVEERALWTDYAQSAPMQFLRLTNTRYALLPATAGGYAARGFREILRNHQVVLVEVPHPAARVHLATLSLPVADRAAALRAMRTRAFEPTTCALVQGGEARTAEGACTLVRYEAEEIVATCDATAPAYAIVVDGNWPGWHATVDGREAPVLTANVAFRAVPIPAGRSTVRMVYVPSGLRAGAVISALALVAAVVLAVRGRRVATVA